MKQHFVTAAYLKAWCDKTVAKGKHVWLISKDNQQIRHQSPYEVFKENDFYTVYDANGTAILELEQKLELIENAFVSLRRDKLENHSNLTLEDRITICLFIATMFARTKIQRDEQRKLWEEPLAWVETLPTVQASSFKNTPWYKQIEHLHKQPMPFHMFNFVNYAMPFLVKMNCEILETHIHPGFITSDNPCIWLDPQMLEVGPPQLFYGLGHPDLEILLPASPKQFISLKSQGINDYLSIDDFPDALDGLNNLVVSYSEKFIVTNQNYYKESWFQKG